MNIYCPNCEKLCSDMTGACPSCGHVLAATEDEDEKEAANANIRCPVCEHECDESATKCPRCKHRLPVKEEPQPILTRDVWTWEQAFDFEIGLLRGVGLCIVIVGAIVVAVGMHKSDPMLVVSGGSICVGGIVVRALGGIWATLERISRK